MSLAAIVSLINERPFRSRQHARQVCSIDDCIVLAVTRGWCQKHYARWRTHDDPLITSRLVGVADEVAALIATGKMESQTCVARIVGVARERVRQIVNRRGLDFKRRSKPLEWPCPRCGAKVVSNTMKIGKTKITPFCRRCSSAGDKPNIRKNRRCSVMNCPRLRAARGYCQTHYSRLRKFGDVLARSPVETRFGRQGCLAIACDGRHHARGYCRAHYDQLCTRERRGIETELPLGAV